MRRGHPSFFHPFILIAFGFLLILSGCSPTRHVPDGSYLLNRVEIKTDAKTIKHEDLEDYVRQKPNSYVFGLFRVQLGIYNFAGNDTTKWRNRVLHRIGQAPILLDSTLMDVSSHQLLRYHQNKGFFDAEINTSTKIKGKKAKVIYDVYAGKPYHINTYEVELEHPELKRIASDSTRSLIQERMYFDVDELDKERSRIANRMRNRGYFHFNKDYLSYYADSVGHKIDLSIGLRDYLMVNKDTLDRTIFQQKYISNVIFNLIPAIGSVIDDAEALPDTLQVGRYQIIGPKKKFLNFKALNASTYIQPGQLFSDLNIERTYAAMNVLPPVKYTHIGFTETAPDSLQCMITVAQAKSFTFSSQAEITFTEGYWGTAGNFGVVHRNLFSGAESLSLQGRLALEKQVDVLAQEWGGQVGIKVPRNLIPFYSKVFTRKTQGSTEFKGMFNYQFRPQEFSSTNVGGGVKYSWQAFRKTHAFDLLNINYVRFPWKSEEFVDKFLETGMYNRYNYEDYLIMRMSYGTSFSSYNAQRPMRNHYTYRYSVESAGNSLYGIYKLFNIAPDLEGHYRTFNIRFSQYLRGQINSSYHHIVDANNKFVYHAGLGVAVPYGNAEIMPFERRFYSGGANSVRGWGESRLGPGTYQRQESIKRRDYNQVGDIKLDLNAEYRAKLFWILEGALFFDAGNIWTIRDYPHQEGGVFRFDSFWKEIAMAYGFGLRMDVNFFVLRVDLGVKLYDPARLTGSKIAAPITWSDMALHIAIGYPF